MPGGSAAQAVNRFLNTVTKAISCVQHTQVLVSEGGRRTLNVVHALVVPPLRLRRTVGDPLTLKIALNYTILDRPDERRADRFKVSTQRYQHHVLADDESDLALFHWHPSTGVLWPHIHAGELNKGQSIVTNRHHIPSGRVSIEAVLRFLITDLGVQANRPDWAEVLDACEGDFRRFATWGR